MGSDPKVIGEGIVAGNASWTFATEDVAGGFTDHVRRSVPLYDEGHDVICRLSDFFVKDGSTCYELGVSTAALLKKLARRHSAKAVHWVGIDKEAAMIEQARQELEPDVKSVSLVIDDINLYPYEKADLIVSYYTIQFVPPRLRQDLFDRIYASLNWGGAFLLFEKVRAADARFQDYMSAVYTDFKLEQGYDAAEVIAKARSLKGVLEPFSTQGNLDLLKRAGFVDCMSVMKWICFEGFLAIK